MMGELEAPAPPLPHLPPPLDRQRLQLAEESLAERDQKVAQMQVKKTFKILKTPKRLKKKTNNPRKTNRTCKSTYQKVPIEKYLSNPKNSNIRKFEKTKKTKKNSMTPNSKTLNPEKL
jgi:hypothetical protein